jgi:hypothetical protein
VSNHELPPAEADVEQLNSKLSQGLKTCRSVVSNYRTLLQGAQDEAPDNDNAGHETEVTGA